MNAGPICQDLAPEGERVRYVVIDDEHAYRERSLPDSAAEETLQVGAYSNVDTFLAVHQEPCHVVILDLCLNRSTGDQAVLQGVRAIRLLTEDFGLRVLVHSADERPDPVARCVAAGAAGYVSKFAPEALASAVVEVGRHGRVITAELNAALRDIAARSVDIRLSAPLEATLILLGRGRSDTQIAAERHLSPRTIEDHKRKILELFGTYMEQHQIGFEGLTRELGVGAGDLVNDEPTGRPARGSISSRMPWVTRLVPRSRRR